MHPVQHGSMQSSGLNTTLRIICLILVITCIMSLFSSASANGGNVSYSSGNHGYGNISINISPEEKTTQPGMSIHPTITIENEGDEEYQDVSILFQASLGRETLPSEQSIFPAPGTGITEKYPLSYPFEVLISIHKPGSEELIVIAETELRERIQVGLPKPGPRARSCGCK